MMTSALFIQALSITDAMHTIEKTSKRNRDELLCEFFPDCQHPICHDAFRCIKKMTDFCHKLNLSPEFQAIAKDLHQTVEKIKTAEKLHSQRN